MSTAGIIFITVIWIVYGVFSAFQRQKMEDNLVDLFMRALLSAIFAPVILLIRMVIGIFHPFSIRDEGKTYQ